MDQALERHPSPPSREDGVPTVIPGDEPIPTAFAGTDGPPHSSRLKFQQRPSAVSGESFAQSVERGLSASPRWLSCSWFYDDRGSALFEQICTLDEYYLTRAEDSILQDRADEIAAGGTSDVTLVELGSGSSTKTRTLIRAFHARQETVEYCPIDIAAGVLQTSALSLLAEFPRLQVRATAADYLDGLRQIESQTQPPRLILFLGSTIGNFSMRQAGDFLTSVRLRMHSSDHLLLGADLRKDPAVIEGAYNDREGVTAAFNKNLLARINRELDGQFNLDAFDHRAPYLEAEGRVEMRLVSRSAQDVTVGALGRTFRFEAGEVILTECCHKYSTDEIAGLASESGMRIEQSWRDHDNLFSLSLLRPA